MKKHSCEKIRQEAFVMAVKKGMKHYSWEAIMKWKGKLT
jgi:hypothetical protein